MGDGVSVLRRVVRARSPTRTYGVLQNGDLTLRCRRFQWWQRVQVVAESKKASSGLTREPMDSAAPDGRCGQHGDGLA